MLKLNKTIVLLTAFAMMLFLAACGGNDAPATEEPAGDDAAVEETADDATEDTVSAADYGAIYEQSCIACHGEGKMGGDVMGMDADEVLTAIIDGPGAMPGNLVTGEDAEGLAVWISQQ